MYSEHAHGQWTGQQVNIADSDGPIVRGVSGQTTINRDGILYVRMFFPVQEGGGPARPLCAGQARLHALTRRIGCGRDSTGLKWTGQGVVRGTVGAYA